MLALSSMREKSLYATTFPDLVRNSTDQAMSTVICIIKYINQIEYDETQWIVSKLIPTTSYCTSVRISMPATALEWCMRHRVRDP